MTEVFRAVIYVLILNGLILSSVSCARFDETAQSAESTDSTSSSAEQARGGAPEQERRLEQARELVANEKLQEAQSVLAPLLARDETDSEVAELAARISEKRARKATDKAEKKESEISDRLPDQKKALEEVQERMETPAEYGETRILTKDEGNELKLKPGPMQNLLEREITIQLREAGVQDLVFALSEIEGVNVIADEKIKSDQKVNISVEGVPLKEVLNYIARNMEVDFHVGEEVIWITEGPPPSELSPSLETKIYHLDQGMIPALSSSSMSAGEDFLDSETRKQLPTDKELRNALDSFLPEGPKGSTFELYRDRNVLIVRNTRENLKLVGRLIEALGERPTQVLIEARFVTISREDLTSLGINLQNLLVPAEGTTAVFEEYVAQEKEITVQKDDSGQVKGIGEERTEKLSEALSEKRFEASGRFPGELGVSGILGNVTYEAVINAIREMDESRTLSAPRVTVLNNRTAYLHRGERRHYFDEYDLQTVDVGDSGVRTELVPVGKAKDLELGFQLQVKPNVGKEGETVMLALQPEITEFIRFDEILGKDVRLPQVVQNRLYTTVAVDSGETVVLGGTLSNDITERVSEVPYLSDVPFLGRLFKEIEEKENPEHLLIFVTANIIGPEGKFIEYRAEQPEKGEGQSDK